MVMPGGCSRRGFIIGALHLLAPSAAPSVSSVDGSMGCSLSSVICGVNFQPRRIPIGSLATDVTLRTDPQGLSELDLYFLGIPAIIGQPASQGCISRYASNHTC